MSSPAKRRKARRSKGAKGRNDGLRLVFDDSADELDEGFGLESASCSIFFNGSHIGSIHSKLVVRRGRNFAWDTDQSQDLHECAAALFTGKGRALPCLRRVDPMSEAGALDENGFLYISRFSLKPQHRAHADKVLEAFLEEGGGDVVRPWRWSVAAYIADVRFGRTPLEKKREREEQDRMLSLARLSLRAEPSAATLAVLGRRAEDDVREMVAYGFGRVASPIIASPCQLVAITTGMLDRKHCAQPVPAIPHRRSDLSSFSAFPPCGLMADRSASSQCRSPRCSATWRGAANFCHSCGAAQHTGPPLASLQNPRQAQIVRLLQGLLGEQLQESQAMSRACMEALLPAYNARNGCDFAGQPVRGNHRKLCSDCQKKFNSLFGGWYWTDVVKPWGADKCCDDCMAQRLGGVFEEDYEKDYEEDY